MGTATITEWDLANSRAAQGGIRLTVDFDPKSLSLTYTPTGSTTAAAPVDDRLVSKAPPQQTGQSVSMTVELTFDTSTTGTSVQEKTDLVVRLTEPNEQSRRVLCFSWGHFLFYGTLSSLTQTIDFFSDSGIPLRAVLNLSLSRVDPPNPDNSSPPAAGSGSSFGANAGIGAGAGFGASIGIGASLSAGGSAGISAGASAGVSFGVSAGTTPLTLSQSGDTLAAITARVGSGASWKSVAAANNIDNPRILPPGTILDAQARITPPRPS
jgi:Contractile injection system tube protein/LysM domain